MPKALSVTWAELLGGSLDCIRVEIRGVVRSVEEPGTRDMVAHSIAMPGGNCVVTLPVQAKNGAREIVDAGVWIAGVCLPIFSRRSEVVNVNVCSNSEDDLVMESPPEEPSSFGR